MKKYTTYVSLLLILVPTSQSLTVESSGEQVALRQINFTLLNQASKLDDYTGLTLYLGVGKVEDDGESAYVLNSTEIIDLNKAQVILPETVPDNLLTLIPTIFMGEFGENCSYSKSVMDPNLLVSTPAMFITERNDNRGQYFDRKLPFEVDYSKGVNATVKRLNLIYSKVEGHVDIEANCKDQYSSISFNIDLNLSKGWNLMKETYDDSAEPYILSVESIKQVTAVLDVELVPGQGKIEKLIF
ncbi:hypothetical protein MF271_19435 (plasmid) [Deinococcus sp. KNUC1210]|uniref:hypothetical protein n=1 Tax=Deinococcus sp. KNUC1210 TaxID=2917691 RepID=UPI001EF1046D|nr:hypothetical protein [Deinococcus sp. KNUC1210]ULH17365.1 hypothetical protein MF271_19435 [Deinococcus sp. KNUC1210]